MIKDTFYDNFFLFCFGFVMLGFIFAMAYFMVHIEREIPSCIDVKANTSVVILEQLDCCVRKCTFENNNTILCFAIETRQKCRLQTVYKLLQTTHRVTLKTHTSIKGVSSEIQSGH